MDGPRRGTSALSVLVVDDDASTRRMLGLALERKGFGARCAGSGEEALALLRERAFDILLSDIHMPDIDGIDLCRDAREIRPGIGLVLITGFQTEESVLRAFRSGAAAYLRKPLELPLLYRTLGQVVDALRETPPGQASAHLEGAVDLNVGPASEETELILRSPELTDAGVVFEPDAWVSFEAPSHRVFVQRFANLSELLLTRGVDADTLEELRVAILELGSNAVEWGHASDTRRPIRLSARILSGMIAIVVEDSGAGFRLGEVPDPTKDVREFQRSRAARGKRPGGYGIALVRAITDHLVYNDRGNVVAMVKRLSPRPSAG
ncbi:MAG: ATP-binding protein [Planctomycetota bacterium]